MKYVMAVALASIKYWETHTDFSQSHHRFCLSCIMLLHNTIVAERSQLSFPVRLFSAHGHYVSVVGSHDSGQEHSRCCHCFTIPARTNVFTCSHGFFFFKFTYTVLFVESGCITCPLDSLCLLVLLWEGFGSSRGALTWLGNWRVTWSPAPPPILSYSLKCSCWQHSHTLSRLGADMIRDTNPSWSWRKVKKLRDHLKESIFTTWFVT